MFGRKEAGSRKELATKGDLPVLRSEIQDVRAEIANTKHEIQKWVMGMMIAQTTLIVTAFGIGIAILKQGAKLAPLK